MFRVVAILAACTIGTLFSRTAVAADPVEVEALITKGNELRRQNKPGEALPYFKKAYDLQQTPRTEAQLGLCELSAGYPVDAEQHLSSALQSKEHPWVKKYGDLIQMSLTRARAQIGELTIEGSPQGAAVTVNGVHVGSLPLTKVTVGKTDVSIHASGYVDFVQSLQIAGGQQEHLTAWLRPSPVPDARPPTPHDTPKAMPEGGRVSSPAQAVPSASVWAPKTEGSPSTIPRARVAAWVVAAGAGVLVAAGFTLQIVSNDKITDFNASCTTANGVHALTGGRLDNGGCQHVLNIANTEKDWSMVGYAAGAAAGLASALLFYWASPASPNTTFRACFRCTPGIGGVSCGGTF